MTSAGQGHQSGGPADIFAGAGGGAGDETAEGQATSGIVRATGLGGVSILKHDAIFLLSDQAGDVRPDARGLGLYEGDTRVLSRFELLVDGQPLVAQAERRPDGYGATIEATAGHGSGDPGGSISIRRERLISDALRERIVVAIPPGAQREVHLQLRLGADFADIFEVRGMARAGRGERLPAQVSGARVTFAYRGLDGVERTTWVRLSAGEAAISAAGDGVVAEVRWQIAGGTARTLEVFAWTDSGSPPESFDEARPAADMREWRQAMDMPRTGLSAAPAVVERAIADLRLLLNRTPGAGEQYVAAGLPWFSALFGRDSLITALQLLPFRPAIARDTLLSLARLQATETDEWRDAQPGKILHELRTGEMARAGEIPHTPYYGTVDATPLWLVLLDEYERRTGDRATVERLWPNALAALRWMDEHGDADGDGFVEYERRSRLGLASQGWKDSPAAIRGRDGAPASGPVALVEVQGYVHAARRGLARLAGRLGHATLSRQQEHAAQRLRERFEEAYWMPDAGTYALALDGAKRQVDVLASNAGHALWSGICSAERAGSVARVLTTPPMWSGWGIRTLAADSVGYDPLGYHIGTVWPHDNAICAAGFARYGLLVEAQLVARAILEAASHFPDARLPELYSGLEREPGAGPQAYPMACAPQAWAAGAVLQLTALLDGLDG